jgi:hypothetical protein
VAEEKLVDPLDTVGCGENAESVQLEIDILKKGVTAKKMMAAV